MAMTLEEAKKPSPERRRTRVYGASRTHHAARWRDIRSAGTVEIVSSWIDEAGPGETADMSELWQRVEREVTSSDRLVLFVQDGDFPLKGALIEAGMALAAGVPVFVVLDPEIKLEERSLRPLGSWARHPRVRFVPTLFDAFTAMTSPSKPSPDERAAALAYRLADEIGAAWDTHSVAAVNAALPWATAFVRMGEALQETGVGTIVGTDAPGDHDWIEDGGVSWCQWCGVHRVEVPDWTDRPQCPAFAKVRAALSAYDALMKEQA